MRRVARAHQVTCKLAANSRAAPTRMPRDACAVRLHVAAKRYLCFVDPGYEAELSPASIGTLRLQGGVMSVDEAAAFEAEPFAGDALAVRGWDDGGKVAEDGATGLLIPTVDHWRPFLADPGLRR